MKKKRVQFVDRRKTATGTLLKEAFEAKVKSEGLICLDFAAYAATTGIGVVDGKEGNLWCPLVYPEPCPKFVMDDVVYIDSSSSDTYKDLVSTLALRANEEKERRTKLQEELTGEAIVTKTKNQKKKERRNKERGDTKLQGDTCQKDDEEGHGTKLQDEGGQPQANSYMMKKGKGHRAQSCRIEDSS